MKALRNALLYHLTVGIGLAQMPADSGWFWQYPLPLGNPPLAVTMLDVNTVVAVGDAGTILRTTDGGATWKQQSSGTTDGLFGVFFTDANTGTEVGYNGTKLRTTTGGEPVASQTTPGTKRRF
jgi:photosystem II stability/assembly factor-like uncharacterized protein